MPKTVQDHHNKAQHDRGTNKGYKAPHSELEKAFTWSQEKMQKQADDNNAYKNGWVNADKQDKK